MANISHNQLPVKKVAYFQQRLRNRIFETVIGHFANEAKERGLTKKDIADRLGKDPAQITRWLSAPSNWSLDTVSDLLLAMDAETDWTVMPFSERAVPNYAHPVMEYGTGVPISFPKTSKAKHRPIITTSSSPQRIGTGLGYHATVSQ